MNPAAPVRVLFVDDDPYVLDGLRRALRIKRHEWHMAFAASGDEALTEMDRAVPDVVVSDMRMPRVDGLTLLKRTAAAHPGTARILLSGQTDQQAATAAVDVAHQFLSKPCDSNDLRATLERLTRHRSSLPADLDAVVGRVVSLPCPPAVVQAVSEAVDSDDTDRVSRLVETVPALAGAVLRLANSAFCGRRRVVADVRVATAALGNQNLQGACVAPARNRMFQDRVGHPSFAWSTWRARAVLTARLASSMFDDTATQGVAWTAGLLRTIGILALAAELPDRYRAVLDRVSAGQIATDAERAEIGATHASLSAALLAAWGLQDVLVDACLPATDEGLRTWSISSAACLAGSLVAECVPDPSTAGERLDRAWTDRLGVTQRLDEWRARTERLAHAADLELEVL